MPGCCPCGRALRGWACNRPERQKARKRVAAEPDYELFNAKTVLFYLNEKAAGRRNCYFHFVTGVYAVAGSATAKYAEEDPRWRRTWRASVQAAKRAEVRLVRCVFGNPFRPITLDPVWLSWNGGTIPTLARVVYEERELPSGHMDPVRLALLADALEDAGCRDSTLLEHLRGPGPRVRGCWAVDLLLGKE